MTNLTADQILDADDLKTEDVKVPEWGGTVTVRSWTGDERAQWEMALSKMKQIHGVPDIRGMKELVVQLSVINGDGKLLFSPKQIPKLRERSSAPVDRIYQVAQRLSHILSSDVEEMVGNSSSARSADSGSSLRSD